MNPPKILAALLIAAVLAVPGVASAINFAQIAASERAVKQMPLEARPNRLGHVYGNNVRRVYYGKWCANCGRYPEPVRRFFYLP